MQLTWQRVRLRLDHPWRIARTLTDPEERSLCRENVVVQLKGDNGCGGWGEASPSARYGQSPESVEGFLETVDAGRLNPMDLPGTMAWLESIDPHQSAARCALNLALWDLAARQAGLPVHRLIGLDFVEGHYVTSFTIGIDAPEVVRLKVEAASAFPVLKLKLGSRDDRALFAALRAAAPEKPVRIDANEAWTTGGEALRQIEWLARDPRVECIEQPMPAGTDPKELAWLKSRSPLPLIADESFRCAADVPRCAETFHGVNVKLVKAGGISGAVEALRAARAAGLRAMIGCMVETSLLISAAAQLAELADDLDIDGSLLIANDPFEGVSTRDGRVSFASAREPLGLRVRPRPAA